MSRAQVDRIGFMPLKSGGEMVVQDAIIGPGGLMLEVGDEMLADREFVIGEEKRGKIARVTQREDPGMALIQPMRNEARGSLFLAMEGVGTVEIDMETEPSGELVTLGWSGQKREGREVSQEASDWASEAIGRPVKLYRSPMLGSLIKDRKVDVRNNNTHFADVWQFLLTNQGTHESLNEALRASGQTLVGIDRFRPNIHVKGWEAFREHSLSRIQIGSSVQMDVLRPSTRCKMPSVDPRTGEFDRNPAAFLSFMKDWHVLNLPVHGENARWTHGLGQMISVGDPVQILEERS